MAWVPLAVSAGISALILAFSLRSLTDERVTAWMEARDVPVTPETRQLVRRELHRTRRWRAYGVVAALLFQATVSGLYAGQYPDPPAIVVWLHDHMPGWSLAIVGFGIGALTAEWLGTRPEAPGRAVVSTRELSDYVSPGLIRMLRWLPVPVAALVPVWLVMPVTPSWAGHEPSMWRLLALAFGAGLAWAVAEPLARRTIERRQRIGDPPLVRADDALRSGAGHAVIAVGIALQLLALSGVLWAIGSAADPKLIRWMFLALALVAVWIALGMWFGYAATSFPFAVRRPVVAAVREDEAPA